MRPFGFLSSPRKQKNGIAYRRNIPEFTSSSTPEREAPPSFMMPEGPHVPLDKVAPGIEVELPDGVSAYVIAERVAEIRQDGEDVDLAFHQGLMTPSAPLHEHLPEFARSQGIQPDEVLFVDLETAGLSNAPVFLIGAMVWEEHGLVVRQYLARDYTEEKSLLMLFSELAQGRRMYVTFNGKSFDIPFLRARAACHRMNLPELREHLDLLHVSRRAWKGQFPDCRLQTLEKFICGRQRSGDIPGSQIPDAYHAFVRTGNAARMGDILKHNRLDLVTLAELMVRLPYSAERQHVFSR